MRPLNHRSFGLLCLLLLLSGCAATVSEAELRHDASVVTSQTLGQVAYLGRSKGYDYFEVSGNVGGKKVKLPVPNNVVREPMPYGSPRRVVGPFGTDRWVP